ncbi:hypothetical protein A2165_00335 [Candidatus Curtissbacteria bacterium RBG_13_40_7]|uniref:Membrane protein insertion efficiency factor n=1 Tax=Candidatus Curtissbacteria bacterium RBG_13_40_7 TaxID=1797706 RepID=A0A1F5FWF8_9BACT|nr:MAG: hypothetical protein A2165_00335 [Candidatus Curtissbacteria bacterium RBG_13_40_7]
MIKFIRFLFVAYQLIFSSPLATCRYQPTCSKYMLGSIEKYGVLRGFLMGVKRVASCHPFSKKPVYDPV